MGITKIGALHTAQTRVKLSNNPSSPDDYYGTGVGHVDSRDWRGGEICYNTTDNRYYVQTATSGTTATWYRLSEQAS